MFHMIAKELSIDNAEQRFQISSWGRWNCGIETFDWIYGQSETCYIQEGKAEIVTEEKSVFIHAGMLVHFPEGLHCVWKVSKPIRKAYKLGLSGAEVEQLLQV